MTWLLVTRSPLWPSVSASSLIPRHPYSAVPLPSNWELWLNFSDAVQQSAARQKKPGVPNWCFGAGAKVGPWSFSRELRPHLSVGGVRNMTVSWPWRLASISGAAGGEFDDGCVVDRWDWLAIGRSLDGRSWHPDGPEFRQYPDSLGYGRGVHGCDHAQPLGSWSGTEENSIAAWPWCCGGDHGSSKRPARSGRGARSRSVHARAGGGRASRQAAA